MAIFGELANRSIRTGWLGPNTELTAFHSQYGSLYYADTVCGELLPVQPVVARLRSAVLLRGRTSHVCAGTIVCSHRAPPVPGTAYRTTALLRRGTLYAIQLYGTVPQAEGGTVTVQ